MITHRFPLEEFQQAFDLLLRDPKEAYKVVFTMENRQDDQDLQDLQDGKL